MTRLMDRSRIAGVGICTAVLTAAAPTLAQDQPLVVMRCSGMSQMLTAPADEGMARAMSLLTQRLKEIPAEISTLAQDSQEAQQAMAALTSIMPLVAGMIDHPCELAIIDHGAMAGMLPDIDVRLVVETGNRDQTNQMLSAVSFIAGMAAREQGLTLAPQEGSKRMALTLPMGQFIFGPADDAGTRFIAGFDAAGDGLSVDAFTVPAPAELNGSKLDAQIYVNIRSITDVAQRVLDESGNPNADQLREMLAQMMPEGNVDIVGASAVKGDRRWGVLRARGCVTLLENVMGTFGAMTGMPPTNFHAEPISADAFRLIPRNVTTASVQIQDLSGMVAPMQMVAYQAGMPELVGFIEALGKTWVTYMSTETGGGGLMSLVMIQPDVNADAMTDSLASLANAANLHATPLHGYVRIRQWDTKAGNGEALHLHSLAFPGLPVPLEISLGVVDGRFIAAATPQALLAAVDHWRSGRPSLADNPRFKESSAGLLDGALKMTFMDMPANLERGYPVAQLVGSAMANFVRSPVDQSRDPGLITPSLATLSENAKAHITVSSVQGGDFVYVSTGDPSLMVNIAGGAGSMGLTPALIGAGVAVALAQRGRMMH